MIMKACKNKVEAITEAILEMMETCRESKEPASLGIDSIVAHEDVLKDKAAVKLSEVLKTRHRDRHVEVRRRGQQKKRPQGSGGSREKLTAACIVMFRRATPALRKGYGRHAPDRDSVPRGRAL
jgi:hypothetical protein